MKLILIALLIAAPDSSEETGWRNIFFQPARFSCQMPGKVQGKAEVFWLGEVVPHAVKATDGEGLTVTVLLRKEVFDRQTPIGKKNISELLTAVHAAQFQDHMKGKNFKQLASRSLTLRNVPAREEVWQSNAQTCSYWVIAPPGRVIEMGIYSEQQARRRHEKDRERIWESLRVDALALTKPHTRPVDKEIRDALQGASLLRSSITEELKTTPYYLDSEHKFSIAFFHWPELYRSVQRGPWGQTKVFDLTDEKNGVAMGVRVYEYPESPLVPEPATRLEEHLATVLQKSEEPTAKVVDHPAGDHPGKSLRLPKGMDQSIVLRVVATPRRDYVIKAVGPRNQREVSAAADSFQVIED